MRQWSALGFRVRRQVVTTSVTFYNKCSMTTRTDRIFALPLWGVGWPLFHVSVSPTKKRAG